MDNNKEYKRLGVMTEWLEEGFKPVMNESYPHHDGTVSIDFCLPLREQDIATASEIDKNQKVDFSNSIYKEFETLECLEDVLTLAHLHAEESFDMDKALTKNSAKRLTEYARPRIVESLHANLEHLKDSGNVLNKIEIEKRLADSDPTKARLLQMAEGCEVLSHESLRKIDPPTEDSTTLVRFHIRKLLDENRGVLFKESDFVSEMNEKQLSWSACLAHVVAKAGKGMATMGRFVTDLSHKTGTSLNGPRVGGKLETSTAISDELGKIVNPDHQEICLAILLCIQIWGEAFLEVIDISSAYFLIPLSFLTSLNNAIYVRENGVLFVMVMSVLSMGLYASGFFWERVKEAIVFECLKRAAEYTQNGIWMTFLSCFMTVDDRLRIGPRAFFERDKKRDNEFLGVMKMGILGRNSVAEKKSQFGLSVVYTGVVYDVRGRFSAISFNRLAKIIVTLTSEIGWTKHHSTIPYKIFMRMCAYTYTISCAIPDLMHYHKQLIHCLKHINTHVDASVLQIKVKVKGANAINTFIAFLLLSLINSEREPWCTPLRVGATQKKPKGLEYSSKEYKTFTERQIQWADCLVTVDASGGLQHLGICFHPCAINGTSIPGAYAIVDTSEWFEKKPSINVLEFIAGLYGVIMASAHLSQHLQPEEIRTCLVHVQTDSTTALSNHLKGGSGSEDPHSMMLLRHLFETRAVILRNTLFSITYSYIDTKANIEADDLSRGIATEQILIDLPGFWQYLLPPL